MFLSNQKGILLILYSCFSWLIFHLYLMLWWKKREAPDVHPLWKPIIHRWLLFKLFCLSLLLVAHNSKWKHCHAYIIICISILCMHVATLMNAQVISSTRVNLLGWPHASGWTYVGHKFTQELRFIHPVSTRSGYARFFGNNYLRFRPTVLKLTVHIPCT